MSKNPSFHGSLGTGARDRRIARLVVVLVVASLAVAITKPWDAAPALPLSTAGPSATGLAAAPSSLSPSGPPALSGEAAAAVGPLPVAFDTPDPPSAASSWHELRWRQLAPDDPLGLVTSVLRGRAGYVAVGWQDASVATPVWTSVGGTHWEPLIFGTPTTFWRGLAVVGLADLRTGLVAITEPLPSCSGPCPLRYVLPIVSWTSADGRQWTSHLVLPVAWMFSPTGAAPLVTVGPAGLVLATSGPASHFAISTDGSHWTLPPEGGFPANFALSDIRGTATGYVAVGRWMTSDTSGEAASLWSSDAWHWSPVTTLLPTSPDSAADGESAVGSLIPGRDGLMAVGWGGTDQGTVLWWQSADGRQWRSLQGYPPLGTGSPTGPSEPHGVLVGDGDRLVAVRGGPGAAAWVSQDGLTWRQVTVSGDLPSEQATHAALLPGGVLLTDGSTAWFGEAVVR